jgi:hypothetical protein
LPNYCRWLVACVIIFVSISPLLGADSRKGKDGKDDFVGAIWRFTLTRDGKKESGQFRVYKDEIFKGATKVGVVQPKDKNETTLVFTEWPEMNGSATLRKVKNGQAAGTLNKNNGSKWEMVINWKDG